MDERRDTAIKLFGKILIPLQGIVEDSIGAGEEENKRFEKIASKTGIPRPARSENSTNSETENEKQRKPKDGDQEAAAAVAKKPDKIEPCPRCDSLDTKFCYYNNYNVSQPRHFCKDCQRYWTAGGSLRNVPVGAGRRKSKSSSCYRRANLNPTHHTPPPTTTTTAVVLSFGSDSPLCESMATVLNLAGARNVFESCEENSSQSSMTGLSSTTDDGAGAASAAHKEVVAQIPCVNGSPWAASAAFGFPLYPAVAYWGYTVPSLHPPHNNSPTLGKHSREGDKLYDGTNSEKSSEEKHFWMPKTLRIGDPDEAAKSSIWSTIGFENKKSSAVCGDGLFKPFQSKDDAKKTASEMPQVLQANPAAFARSMNYRETS